MKRRLRRTVVVLITIALAAVVVWWLTLPKPVAIAVERAERGAVAKTVTNTRAGTVKACNRAKLSPATGGQVAKLYVKKGDPVKKGEILMEIWNQDLRAELALAQSEAKAAQASANETCVRAESAQREADRQKALKQRDLVAEETVDRAVTNAKASQDACRAARAQVQVAKNKVATAQEALQRTILRAPFAGRVAEINAEVGEYSTPSPPGIPTPPAIDLVDTSCLYVSAPIDEVDAPAIKPGMPARITLDAFPGKDFAAKVRRVAPYVQELEKQARTVDVEAVFTKPEEYQQLLPGYSADLEVIIAVRDNVLRVPTDAVLQGDRVYIYDPQRHRISQRDITAGLSNWQYTQVVSGLKAGELVVTSVDRKGVAPGAVARPEQPPAAQ